MKSAVALIIAIVALAAFATTAVNAADGDNKYTKERFKSDVKAVGTGIKDSAGEVGHQIATGTKKANNSAKTKIKQDVMDGKLGEGSLAKKNDSLPAVTEGRNTN